MGDGLGAARLRRRRRIDGHLVRHEHHQPAHHLLLPARLHGHQSGRLRRADAALRSRRRLRHLSERRRGRPLEHADGHDHLTTLATTAIGGADESAWLQAPVDPSLLVAGTNVIAVEMHQQSPSSTDVSFDLELRATEAQAPAPDREPRSPGEPERRRTSPRSPSPRSVSAPAGLASATLVRRRPAADGRLQRPGAGRGRADHRRRADDRRRQRRVDQRRRSDAARARADEVSDARRRRRAARCRPGAIITSATLQLNCTNAGNAMRLYRLTQRLDRGRGHLERARARRGVGVAGRRRRRLERRRGR